MTNIFTFVLHKFLDLLTTNARIYSPVDFIFREKNRALIKAQLEDIADYVKFARCSWERSFWTGKRKWNFCWIQSVFAEAMAKSHYEFLKGRKTLDFFGVGWISRQICGENFEKLNSNCVLTPLQFQRRMFLKIMTLKTMWIIIAVRKRFTAKRRRQRPRGEHTKSVWKGFSIIIKLNILPEWC